MPRPTVDTFIPSDAEHDANPAIIQEHLAYIRSRGIPTCGAELLPSVDDAENCWDELWSVIDFRIPLVSRVPEGEIVERILAILESKPRMVVLHDYDVGSQELFPELPQFKLYGTKIVGEAELALARGDRAQARRRYLAVAKMATECARRPEAISLLIGYRLLLIAFASLKKFPASSWVTEIAGHFVEVGQMDLFGPVRLRLVRELADCRRLDLEDPEIGYGREPEFLPPTSSDVIPHTKLGRLAYRWLLDSWRPAIDQIVAGDESEIEAIGEGLRVRRAEGFTPEAEWIMPKVTMVVSGGKPAFGMSRKPPIYRVEAVESYGRPEPSLWETREKARAALRELGG